MTSFNNLDSHIIDVGTSFSEGVSKENRVTVEFAKTHFSFAESCHTPEEYYTSQSSNSFIDYAEFIKSFSDSDKKLKILDIGVGRGESSVYLATLGHSVTSVEPSYDFCTLIAFIKNKFNLDIKVVRTVGEEIDKISKINNAGTAVSATDAGNADKAKGMFDIVIFNASLHHCDDPEKALRNAFSMLVPGGKVFLSSEIQIRPWVDKKRWYWMLENYPEKMNHYGGNEHAYYSWEYTGMMKKAGFQETGREPSGQFLNPSYRVERDLKLSPLAHRSFKGKMIFIVRVLYYYAMAGLVRVPFLFQPLTASSLISCQFLGIKK